MGKDNSTPTPYSIQWKTSTWKKTRPRKQTQEEMRQLNENWKSSMERILNNVNTSEDSIVMSPTSIKRPSFLKLNCPGIINKDKIKAVENFQNTEKENHQNNAKYKEWKENPFFKEGEKQEWKENPFFKAFQSSAEEEKQEWKENPFFKEGEKQDPLNLFKRMDEMMGNDAIRKIWEEKPKNKKVSFNPQAESFTPRLAPPKISETTLEVKEEENIEKGEVEAFKFNTGWIEKMEEEKSGTKINLPELGFSAREEIKKEEFKPKLEYMELEGNILADVDLTTQPIILTKEQSSLRYEPGIQSQDFLDHPEKKKIKRGELSEYLDPLAKKITDYILQKTGTELKNATKEKESLDKTIKKGQEIELKELREKIGKVQTKCLKLEIEAQARQQEMEGQTSLIKYLIEKKDVMLGQKIKAEEKHAQAETEIVRIRNDWEESNKILRRRYELKNLGLANQYKSIIAEKNREIEESNKCLQHFKI